MNREKRRTTYERHNCTTFDSRPQPFQVYTSLIGLMFDIFVEPPLFVVVNLYAFQGSTYAYYNTLARGIIKIMNIVEYRDICQVHQWLEVRGIPHTHVVNEQPSKKRAIAEKRMGKSKGFPDLLIFLPNGVNVAIEMKTPRPAED